MRLWQSIGNFLGRHMALCVPLCVLLAVLFPEYFAQLKPAVPYLFALMTLVGSLSNTVSGVLELLRRPLPLIAVLAFTNLILPLCARLFGGIFFGQNPALMCGLVLECSIPIAVASIMWNSMYDGHIALALALVLISTLIAPISIPMTLWLLVGQSVHVDVAGMMGDMALQIALPAFIGVGINELSGGWGRRVAAPAVSPASKILLLGVILINATSIAPFVRNFRVEYVAVAVFVFVLVLSGFMAGVLISKLLAFDGPHTLTATFACGLRNTSSGVVVTSQFLPAEAMVPVIMVTLFQQTMAAVVGKRLHAHLAGDRPRTGEAGS